MKNNGEARVLGSEFETMLRYRLVIFAAVHCSALLAECRALLEVYGYRVETIEKDPASALSKDVFQIKAEPTA